MKKVSSHRKRFLVLRQQKIERKRSKRKRPKNHMYKWSRDYSYSNNSVYRAFAPRAFSIFDGVWRPSLLNFIGRVRAFAVHNPTSKIEIDFTHTEVFQPDGLLLFKAEIERLKMIFPELRITCKLSITSNPTKAKIKQVLSQVGLLDVFSYHKKVPVHSQDVIHWRQAGGEMAEADLMESIFSQADGIMDAEAREDLYVGLTEAMTNSTQHAYIENRDDGLDIPNGPGSSKRWWAFSQIRNNRFTVVFCDLGVGIPVTMPVVDQGWFDKLRSLLGRQPKDGEVIKHAIEEGASRTKEQQRGKGLRQLKQVIQNMPESVLIIHSNRGRYLYRKGQEQAPHDYNDSILGTLIAWSIPFNPRPEAQNAS